MYSHREGWMFQASIHRLATHNFHQFDDGLLHLPFPYQHMPHKFQLAEYDEDYDQTS